MRRIIQFLLLALCLVACEQKEKAAMSVANKTFYHHSSSSTYYRFSSDSVFYFLGNLNSKGTYIQQSDIVKMKMENRTYYDYGVVNDHLFIIDGTTYTLEKPTN